MEDLPEKSYVMVNDEIFELHKFQVGLNKKPYIKAFFC